MMGGYGGYVWVAFGFTLLAMIGLLWQSWRAQRGRADELAKLRRTVRGGRATAAPAEHEPTRRLVARRPQLTPPATDRTAALGPTAAEQLATSRTTSGT